MTARPNNGDLFELPPSMSLVRVASVECPHCGGQGRIAARTMGERLRALRQSRGLSPEQLSAMTGGAVGHANVRLIERDANKNPSVSALTALASVLGVKVGYLIAGEE